MTEGQPGARPWPAPGHDLAPLLARVARGDQAAFAMVYDHSAAQVFGLVRRVVRDPAQSEEVTQEVMLEVWRTASRFDPHRGSAMTWLMTMAHRRAVDRVRSGLAAAQREARAAVAVTDYDVVAEEVETRLDAQRVRRCLDSLTELQRESVTLAYYGGYTYREVAGLLGVAVGTVKTRMRDGLIRLRDCLGGRIVKIRREVPHTLAGAYALDALTEPDRVRFERHLAGCEACRQEAGSLREAAGQLAAVSAVPPPPHVRERVLAEAARSRQQPPLTVDALAGPGVGRRGVRWRAPRMAVAIAGGCILVALVLGGLFIHTQRSLNLEQAHNRTIATILNAPDATIMSARAVAGGGATVVMSHRDHALVLTTAMLPALPAGQRYQVWLMGPRRTRAAGMLPAPHRGMTAPMIVSGVAAGDMVGLTVEPASGSAVPSSVPVLMLVLPF